ncbi:MAG: hypothetical protein HZA17_09975 [Nitrospirae bacterium]|nr:hypothetical protein [Nitrospirota bacterium]
MEAIRENACADMVCEIVLYQGEGARRAHQELFSLDAACYRSVGTEITGAVLSAYGQTSNKLHIVAGWEAVLRVALWTSAPLAVHDALALIRKSGAADVDIEPFRRSEINDILPWLYYSKKFDILRRICNSAKAKAESKAGNKKLLVYCHLFSEETGRIIASSL